MSANTKQKQLATTAGITQTQAQVLSGADLAQKALATAAATAVGPGNDGARFEQIAAGQV